MDSDLKTIDYHKMEEERDETSSKIGKKLLQGWTMLAEVCPLCEVPLMREPKTNKLLCVKCDKEILIQKENEPLPSNLRLELPLKVEQTQSSKSPLPPQPIQTTYNHPDWNILIGNILVTLHEKMEEGMHSIKQTRNIDHAAELCDFIKKASDSASSLLDLKEKI